MARNYNLTYDIYNTVGTYHTSVGEGRPGVTRKIIASYLMNDGSRIDTLTYAIIDCQRIPDAKSRDKIVKWLKAKTGDAHLQLIVE